MNQPKAARSLSPTLEKMREQIRSSFDPEFDFQSPGQVPWCRLEKPLAQARIAVVSTSGLHLASDSPFRAGVDPLGDTSFRIVPQDTKPEALALDAHYVDQRLTASDPEVALPTRALAALAAAGEIGAVAPRHYCFCGGILRPFPGLSESATQVFECLREDQVDAVVLAPTCSICVQTVCLLARELESRGLPTVCLTLVEELSRIVGAPRTLRVRFPFGAAFGDPGNRSLQRAVLEEALGLLVTASSRDEIQTSQHGWRRPPQEEP